MVTVLSVLITGGSARDQQVDKTESILLVFGYGQSLSQLFTLLMMLRNSITRVEFCVETLPFIMTHTHTLTAQGIQTNQEQKVWSP